MPDTISAIATQEKNKLASDSVFFSVLEITVPSLPDPIRVTNVDTNVTWRGVEWVKLPYELSEITVAPGEEPSSVLKISNVNDAIGRYVKENDLWCKINGYQQIIVDIIILNSYNLASDIPEITYTFTLEKQTIQGDWVTFDLGVSSPAKRRCPLQRMLKNQCRFRFKSTECGYTGSQILCDKSLTRCRALGNSARYGGFLGIGGGGIQFAK